MNIHHDPPTVLLLLALSIALRQPDRIWHSARRGQGFSVRRSTPETDIRELVSLQRSRTNNLTPVLLLTGLWLEIGAWWMLIPIVALDASGIFLHGLIIIIIGVRFRHLQEVTHFAAHGILSKSKRLGDVLAEVAFQTPMSMPSIQSRRKAHVEDHHPSATILAVDPNVRELANAGISPRATRTTMIAGLLYPLTRKGMARAAATIAIPFTTANMNSLHNNLILLLVPLIIPLVMAGPFGIVTGFLIPRLVIYPMLSWASLLVEHNWFVGEIRKGNSRYVEFQRCIRLYRLRRLLELFSRSTWLPYGDLYHYAHSVYPRLRWNYLPIADKLIGPPALECSSLALRGDSLLDQVYLSRASSKTCSERTGVATAFAQDGDI